ncbi:flavin-containing monooxygenase [Marssonina coronariae]|uniref:Flavin-containing monooxygenase n=1 Tax=Diplocarpon coronariae TaxID=2795749 RepID=A0A218ZI61_9HELO|nr:flavin-containing monooxygenase [Marssonina coronariae]
MAKRVCIIGAGPSGLVAAKTLTHDTPPNTFHVTVFDSLPRIGGLWPTSTQDDGLVNPDMCTNQSRHTVSFSDLAWEEKDPLFPKAWMVGRYLERYLRTYGGHGEFEVRLGMKAMRSLRGENGRWRVWVRGEGGEEELEFDYLVVASGFFGKAKMPTGVEGAGVPVVHSSKVRHIKSLLAEGAGRGRKIVIVGGQMSGVETAAVTAMQISSAANTPGPVEIEDAGNYTVTHLVQKPVWVMPLFFPGNPVVDVDGEKRINKAPEFLPLDLASYNIGWRAKGPVLNTSGHITPGAAGITHSFMETYIGGDQRDYGPELGVVGKIRSEPPLLACSDHYIEFVRHKKINVMTGHLNSASGDKVIFEDPFGKLITIEDVAAIICATGFDAAPSLDFLPEDVLKSLDFDPTDDGFPLALNVDTTLSKKVPSLGFVGFYRSPYWGVMEMQSRFLSKLWGGDAKAMRALEEDSTMESMMKLRKDPRRAQFPMGDYAYLMESFAEILGIKRHEPSDTSVRTGIITPYRYSYSTKSPAQRKEIDKSMSAYHSTFIASSQNAKFVPRAVFRGFQGIWKLSRTITSRIPTFPSGTLIGTASLLPRTPTDKEHAYSASDKSEEPKADMEYLYFEEGEFMTDFGATMNAKRSYVYRYFEERDCIDLWFAKQDYLTADYFFHRLKFIVPEKGAAPSGSWKAVSSHLCIDDMYDVNYEFTFRGATLGTWSAEYTVKGPQKDYMIRNVYTRPAAT